MGKKTIIKYIYFYILTLFISAVFVLPVFASSTDGTIDSSDKYAWGENIGWLNFGTTEGNVHITDSALTGYVWAENIGWISLNCSNDLSCVAVDYKITNDGEGTLTGYAWGENIGWVNFAPTNGGVHINSAGEFSGYAWGENTGWIVFNCQDLDICVVSDFKVRTTWLPLSVRNQNESDDEEEGVEISDVRYSSTDTTIVINWKTNHDADSHVRWGRDKNFKKEKNDNKNEKKHRVVLRNLDPDTQYYFRVKSTDKNDNSDSSRIYSISTKPTSTFFVKRHWEKMPNGSESEENYEKIDVDVTDKSETEIENGENLKKSAEMGTPNDGIQQLGIISRLFSGVKNTVAGFFSSVYDLALGGQRKITEFFDWTGDKIAGVCNSFVAKFNKEKANEIARLHKTKYFTTEVFNRNERKLLAEVRFQILDKSDNPVPNLETMLFSDPQTSVTDDNGIASFKDVPIGSHTLAFDYEGENFRKNVAISDTLTDEGNVRAEIVQVKAEKEKIAMWMWILIVLLIIAVSVAIYFAKKYYRLKKNTKE